MPEQKPIFGENLMTTRLILIRHGQTAWNSEGRFMGQRDIPLDETGQRQVTAVAKRLSRERPAPLAIYASDLKRAWNTAQAIQQAIAQTAHPEPAPVLIADPRLREMDFGNWEGFTFAEIQATQPEAYHAWEVDMFNIAPPEGETIQQMTKRARESCAEIALAHPDGTAFVVAHGGSLQALILDWMGIPVERIWQVRMSNTGISEVSLHPEGVTLNRFNDTYHLENLE